MQGIGHTMLVERKSNYLVGSVGMGVVKGWEASGEIMEALFAEVGVVYGLVHVDLVVSGRYWQRDMFRHVMMHCD
jgi:hypothetical protein